MKTKIDNISAAILSGGKNSRMSGINKAFIQLNGTSIIHRTVELLRKIFDEIILVTNSPESFRLYEKEVVVTKDIIKDIGPLGGIHAALLTTSKDAVFFVACDMPFLHNELIISEVHYYGERNCDALVPKSNNFIEPLHAIYKKHLSGDICRFVEEHDNYSIKNFLKTINVCYWDLEDNSFHRNIFRNLNTPDDLVKIIKR